MYEGVIGAGEETYCGFARESYQIGVFMLMLIGV